MFQIAQIVCEVYSFSGGANGANGANGDNVLDGLHHDQYHDHC